MSTPMAIDTAMATTQPSTTSSNRAVTNDELERLPGRPSKGKQNDRFVSDDIDSHNGFNWFDFIQIRLDFSS